MPTTDASADLSRDEQRGLDRLELALPQRKSRARRIWSATWPKLAALGLVFAIWQLLFWSGWRDETIFPAPVTVLNALYENFGDLLDAAYHTMRRAIIGFSVSVVLGIVIGAAVARIPVLRSAVGSMITGLQTMPSVAWYPAALVLFKLTEGAIFFVVILGATPSIINGLLAGFDTIPPIMLRTGKVLGARGLATLRYVILPAALPSFVAGLKQGWAFVWRSLLAGELFVSIAGSFTLGQQLNFNYEFVKYPEMYATMIVIFAIGAIIDAVFFANAERVIRRRYGFIDEAAEAR